MRTFVRAMSGVGIGLSVAGVAALVAMGRADHLPQGPAMFAVVGAGFGALAWLATPHQPTNRALWVPATASLILGVGVAGWPATLLITASAGLDVSVAAFSALTPTEIPLGGALTFLVLFPAAVPGMHLMITLGPLLFPDGRLPSPRWRWVAWAVIITMGVLTARLIWVWRPTGTYPYFNEPSGFIDILFLVLLGLAVICGFSLVLQHRRSTGETRLQYRWVLLGTAALFFSTLIVGQGPWELLAALGGAAVGVACYAVAVTKYRLYDIDIIISRAVLYGSLAAFIGAVYVVVVVVVGALVEAQAGNLGLPIVATALVAVGFEPVRRRAQRWANRIVYGERAAPYEVLTELTRRLSGTEPAEGVLLRMARLMADGTGAEQATVWLAEGDRLRAAAGHPEMRPSPEVSASEDLDGAVFPVTHDGEPVGALQVIMGRGEQLRPPERRLLADLAGSAGLVMGNQRLNAALTARAAELRESRRRLVEAQDAERRRLERNLHDGAQQQVVALKVKLGLAERLAVRAGLERMTASLHDLTMETQGIVDEIRQIARGIYPPLLEAEGLGSAIKARAAATPFPVEVEVGDLGRYPRDVESAVYFAALEAIESAVRQGEPSKVRVSVQESGGELILEIVGDGTGFDTRVDSQDDGLTDVRDRIDALGGETVIESAPGEGTRLSVRLPLDTPEALVEERETAGFAI